MLSLSVSWGDVATMCHSHHQCNPVCGRVCQAHLWLHGPLSERSDYPTQSRSVHNTRIQTPCSLKSVLHIAFSHLTVRSCFYNRCAFSKTAGLLCVCLLLCKPLAVTQIAVIIRTVYDPQVVADLPVQISHASRVTWEDAWVFCLWRMADLVLTMLLPLPCLLQSSYRVYTWTTSVCIGNLKYIYI